MKSKTSELQGPALDWAVAKCEGKNIDLDESSDPLLTLLISLSSSKLGGIAYQPLHSYTPSTDWAQGGPIIERERIRLDPRGVWCAAHDTHEWAESTGPTPLIAAMRCYVASKLGEEVEVPNEFA